MSEPKNNSLFSFFIFFVLKEVYSAIAPHLFSQIYTALQILIGFAYSLIPVGFRSMLTSVLSFMGQKTYLGEFLRAEVILRRIYLRKCSIWPAPSFIINFSFIKNVINSEPLGVTS